ncbi:hypothetical protein [Nocardia wallacei]|uniref:hypothetical protein n=1 Tax=Nocardia wallacei TaxID=480035 RepID=UPI002454533B|nr:hypothetical protein [Nocardia wallacei]
MSDNTDNRTPSPAAESDTGTADSTAANPSAETDSTTAESNADTDAATVNPGTETDSPTAATESGAGTGPPATASMSSRLRRLRPPVPGRAGRAAIRSAVAVVLGAAVAGSIYFYVQNEHKQDLLSAQEQARQAACGYGPVLSTYDAKNLDHYVQAVLDGATGDWRKQFETTSRDLGDVLAKGEVVAKTDDVQCAIRSADETSAEALVVMGQTITSLGTKGQPEKGQLSVVMRLEKSGDRWLVNKIDTPLAPPRP